MQQKKEGAGELLERKYQQFSEGFDMGVSDALINKRREPKNRAASETPKFQGYIAGQYFIEKCKDNDLKNVYNMAHRYLKENNLEDVKGLYGKSYVASKQR